MGTVTLQRYILVKRENEYLNTIPTLYGKSPKDAWDLCERVYGRLQMNVYQDEGYTAVPCEVIVRLS